MQKLGGTTVLVDGVLLDRLPVADRGLQYGDGLFETLAVSDGRPCLWDRHLSRLQHGCQRLGFTMPAATELRRLAATMTAAAARGVLKIIVTRGSGGRGYRPPDTARPRHIMTLSPWPDWPPQWQAQGVRIRLCDTPVADSPAVAGLKHLGRLEQVLARAEWQDPAIAEGLMLDSGGNVIEGTQSNLFLERQGRLLTPPLTGSGVAGVVRGLVMELAAAAGSPVTEQALRLPALYAADALYLTNSLIGVWQVRALGEHVFAVGPELHPVMAQAIRHVYGP